MREGESREGAWWRLEWYEVGIWIFATQLDDKMRYWGKSQVCEAREY